jgi:hypothetical protein
MGEMGRYGVMVDFNDVSGSVASDVAYLDFVIVSSFEGQRSKCHTNNERCSGS